MERIDNIQKLLAESAGDSYTVKRKKAKALARKWERVGLLEGLDRENDILNMSLLLENQAKQLLKESTATGTTVNAEEWSGVALPLVRRVFGQITAKDFVSVQPMNLPSGLVFYINYKYGTDKPGWSAATIGTDKVHGVTSGTGAPYGGFYGQGRFGYATNNYSASVACTTGSVSMYDIEFNEDYSSSLADSHAVKLTIPTSSAWHIDAEGVKSFMIISGSDGIDTVYSQYTKVDGANLVFIVSGSVGGSTPSGTLYYSKQPLSYDRGDFEYKGSTDIAIPEINMDLESLPIVAKTKKLKAQWTPEIAQDLNAYQSIDAEAELTTILSDQISMEIDLEILSMLLLNTDTTEYWSARPGYEYDSTAQTFSNQTNYYISNKADWYKSLLIKIQKVSNEIHKKTMRGGANFIVVSPDVATILESIPGYQANTSGDDMEFNMGVEKVGTITNRWKVYKNPYMTANVMLMGYRGASFLETGAVYAPYVPLIMTPLIYDPVNLTPVKGVMTRFAKKMIRKEFYGKVIVGDLDYV